jgi:hypothetical protein
VGQEISSATTEATERNMGLSVIVFMQTAPSAEQKRLHLAQQTNFCSFNSKHSAFYWRYNARRNSTSSYLCSCTSPVPTSARKLPSSTARALLPGTTRQPAQKHRRWSEFYRPRGACLAVTGGCPYPTGRLRDPNHLQLPRQVSRRRRP